jgi:hypothetical protein
VLHSRGDQRIHYGKGREYAMGIPDPRYALPDPRYALPDPRYALPDPRYAMGIPDPRYALPDPRYALLDSDITWWQCGETPVTRRLHGGFADCGRTLTSQLC